MEPTELQAALGRAIREARVECGYSQEAFADAVGLHRTYMGGIERGERNIGLHNLARIAEALAMSPSELLALAEQKIEDG
ncbi:MAG: helix-turn-helix transcriptional regulator [Rubrobacter sp.]|jgi:transcriptional regulator with XRE-family HTH domain|nr:helix-turn-helix transcriptional regulator [Rubrobacter sp.]